MSEITLPNELSKEAKHELSRADRATSFALADFPLPHGREEDWRFTPLARIESLLADHLEGRTLPPTVSGLQSEQDSAQTLGEGQEVAWGASGRITYTTAGPKDTGLVGRPSDRAAVVAWQNATHTTTVTTGNGETHATPLRLQLAAPEQPGAGHVRIHALEDSAATVVLHHLGSGKLAQTVEAKVEAGARLTLVSVQEWENDATHTANHRVEVAEGGQLKHVVITLGGDLVRLCTDVTFGGLRADVNLLGLYFTRSGEHQEHRIFVNHEVADAKSRVTYKGALQGDDAHSVWVGDVSIGHQAFGTDTYELNRNLVLGKGPRADSVPNLEIQNGQIEGAGHASATGRFDDEQLFYLCSRGIGEEEAKRMVVRAFFAELLGEIDYPALSEHLMEVIETQLEQGGMKL